MTTTSEPARLIRGYGGWVLLLMIVLAAAAWGLSLLEPTRYRAEATLVAEPRMRTNIAPVPADPATESEIARSSAVLRPAAATLGIAQQDLSDGLTVSPAKFGTSFTIAYESPTAPTARTRAQAVATQYLSYRNATTAQSGISAALITPASSATRVTWLPPWMYATIGALTGLLIGVVAVRLRTRDRVHGRVHFEHLTGMPVLATIPRARRSRGPGAPLPVLLRSPASADAEAYRYLRARLEACLEGPATVLVTSAHEGEGRSTTAANLAIALAQSGRRVVLIDTDVRGPVLHQMFALSRDRGLTGILTGDITGASALRDGPVPNLRLMAAGPDQDGAPDLLATSFGEMLRELKSECDVIVLDSAPALHVADAVALAAVSDLVLLVADFDRLSRSTARHTATVLTPATAAPVAAVLIAVPDSRGGLIPRTRAGRAPAPTPSSPAPTPSSQIPTPDRRATPDRLTAPGRTADPDPRATPNRLTAPGRTADPDTRVAPSRLTASGRTADPDTRATPNRLTASGRTADADRRAAPDDPGDQPTQALGSAALPPALGLAARAHPSAGPSGKPPSARPPATATGPAFARQSHKSDPGSGPTVPNIPADSARPSTSKPSPNPSPASPPAKPTSAPPTAHGSPAATAKAAVPKPRLYTSSAASEAETATNPDPKHNDPDATDAAPPKHP
ncbi:CpsD/CapB family tyrosine-protein kinase [Paractinoplanes atraurantiacus]|uniref:Capsular exopolysaccharide family n=1 Tax=Paractinoplanes atraurantiacus TaxID=1036182 RepID=A0A285HWZ4_9ACTN|nr:CpsD/CapB family tyrosine-protein kinase [Actinoplanes atraurantiacus]SNY40163.1 capsular exopolysaccharide family [Actinoplanes atraurantiacus]